MKNKKFWALRIVTVLLVLSYIKGKILVINWSLVDLKVNLIWMREFLFYQSVVSDT